MKNKLVVIGWLGWRTCYLNVDREEAVRRWKEDNDEEKPPRVDEFEFEDEFEAYDAWK